MREAVDVTVVVPVVERPGSLVDLYAEFSAPLRAAQRSYEFLFACHPGYASLLLPLRPLVERGEPIRLLQFGQPVAEGAMLKVAAGNCRGQIMVTLPAYRQVEAGALLGLIETVERGAEMAVAWRWPRLDSVVNRLQSRVLHALVGGLAGGRLHDVACGVRAMRPEVLRNLRLYGDLVRFLPLLARREGYQVEEVPSPVHPTAMKPRTYAPGVYVRRLLDVLGLVFLFRFTDKPLRFFGLIGLALGLTGSISLLALFFERVIGATGIANRPFLLLGTLLLTLGVQAIALGLVGEIIVHVNAASQSGYRTRPELANDRPAVPAAATPPAPHPRSPRTSPTSAAVRQPAE